MEFASTNFKIVAAIRAASAVVSLVLCLIVIVINVASQKYVFHLHRMVLYYSIAGVMAGITKALNRVDYFVENSDTKAFCTASGFMDQYASWASVFSALRDRIHPIHRGLRTKQRQQMCKQFLATVDIRFSFIFQLDSVHPYDLWSISRLGVVHVSYNFGRLQHFYISPGLQLHGMGRPYPSCSPGSDPYIHC